MRRGVSAAAGGLAFSVCGVAALALAPPPPMAASSAVTVRHYLALHATAIRSAAVVSALGALTLLPFLVALRRRLAGTAGDTLFAAGILTCAVSILGSVLQAGLVNAQPRLTDSGLLAFFSVQRDVFYVGPPVLVSVMAAAAALAYRGIRPAWLVGLSALLGLTGLVGGASSFYSEGTAAGGVGLAGFLLTIGWCAASSVYLLREEPVPGGSGAGRPVVPVVTA